MSEVPLYGTECGCTLHAGGYHSSIRVVKITLAFVNFRRSSTFGAKRSVNPAEEEVDGEREKPGQCLAPL